MKLEIGTLVEVTQVGADGSDKMVIIKIDHSNGVVVLENKDTKVKTQMSFKYFTESTGIQLDTRTLLKG